MNTVQRFFNLLRVDKQEILTLYTYALFNGLISLSLPLGIQAIINLISGGQVSTSWIVLVLFVIVGVGLTGLMQIMQLSVTESLQRRIFTRSAFEFAYRIPKLKLSVTDRYHIPELVNRFFDTLSVQKGLSKILVDFSTASLQVIFGLILLSLYHPVFILFSLTLLLIILLIFRFTARRGLRTSLKESSYKYEVAHWLEELARSLSTFKRAGDSTLALDKTDEKVAGYLGARKAHFKMLVIQYVHLVGFKIIIATGLLFIGGLLVIDQQMNIGQFVASEIIIILVLGSVEKLILSMETIYDVLTSIEKIGLVTDIPLDRDDQGSSVQSPEGPLEVKLRDVGYAFPDQEVPLLDKINLHIKSGEKVVIAGDIGSGKSMLLKVLAGLYDDFKGSIVYNDLPIRNWDVNRLFSRIGDNLDHQELFHGTMMENITLNRPGVDHQQIVQLVNEIGLQDYLESLNEGYETIVLPGGKGLPSGVRQKILFLRSLAGTRDLLLLDNPLRGLPADDQRKMMDVLKKHDATTIVICSDDNGYQDFDRCVLLRNGQIVEQTS
ncbi:MAG: ATP-binding cassette domain-containing protein [Flavobacteriales bacterium]|nr:ATP-binding cassette domain-containing protein [Bacteroidota bacterium]MCB9241069.1 ATP-binding cassette domain-containing protein [Flavobacteriales bacterium]